MVKITKVVTKTGDKGVTSLAGGHNIEKQASRIHLIGDIDELNAHIAFAAESIKNDTLFLDVSAACLKIQHQLFNLGASLAVLPQDQRQSTPRILLQDITELETQVDNMNNSLPSLNSFILPGGSESAARFHIARTVCRRAERTACQLLNESTNIDHSVIPYLNRLSDWLFVVARHILFKLNQAEILWNPAAL